MAQFQSLPVVQAQPPDGFYQLAKINLFGRFTRPTYSAAYGVDPPTGDPTKRPKVWQDDSLAGKDPGSLVAYSCVDASKPGFPVVGTITMTVAEAMSVNLPGNHSYPPYIVSPTTAHTQGPDGPLSNVNPNLLSMRDQAVALAASWGLDASAVSQATLSLFSYIYPPDEPRREWQISYNGLVLNVGQFVAEMYANGIGTPGHWDLSSKTGGPNWISDKPPVQTFALPEWPDPIRSLLANETLRVASALGAAGVVVVRTDVESPYNHLTGGLVSTGGGLTIDQAASLQHIKAGVDAILQAAMIPPPA